MIAPWETPALNGLAVWDARDVRALAASPDGRTLWGALRDRVDCWEVPSGRVRATLAGHATTLAVDEGVIAAGGLGWSRWGQTDGAWRGVAARSNPDRTVLALGTAPDAVVLRGARRQTYWGAGERKVETAFELFPVALCADGAVAAALGRRSSGDERLLVFDAERERCRAALGAGLAALAWAGDHVVVGGAATLCCYSPQRRRTLWSRALAGVGAIAVSRDGATVAALSSSGGVAALTLLRAADGRVVGEWSLTPGALAWRGDGVAHAVDAGARLNPRVGASAALAVAPDGAWCALACEEGVLIVGREGELVAAPRNGFGAARCAEWLADGRVAVAYSNEPAVRVLRPGDVDVALTLEHDGRGTYELYPSPDGRRLIAHARDTGDHGLRLCELADGTCTAARAEGMSAVEWVEWTDACDALWVACWPRGDETTAFAFELWRVDLARGARRVWRRDGLRLRGGWFQSLHRVDERLYAALPDRCLTLDPGSGEVIAERRWPAPPFAFLDVERVLSWDGRAFDVARGALLYEPPRRAGEMEPVRAVARSRRWALSALLHHHDPSGRVLRARATADGALLRVFDVPDGGRARLSRDGRALALVEGGALRLYRVDADALDAAARAAGG